MAVRIDYAAAAPWASSWITGQCLATNFAAWSLINAKSLPERARQIVASGSADHKRGDDLYFETLPAKRMKAQSALAVLQADNRNTVAIRSGPSCSSRIVSAKQTYFNDFAATLAPAGKMHDVVDTPISRRGAPDKVGSANIDVFPPCGPADSANRKLACQALIERKAWGYAAATAPMASVEIAIISRVARLGLPQFGLEFAQPRRNAGKDVRLVTMRATQLSSVARQNGEARWVQVNAGVDYIAGRGAHKIQRGHHFSCGSNAGMVSAGLVLGPRADNPYLQRSLSRRFLVRTSANGLSLLVENPRLVGASPKQKHVHPSALNARISLWLRGISLSSRRG
jgi:hypothetical protein